MYWHKYRIMFIVCFQSLHHQYVNWQNTVYLTYIRCCKVQLIVFKVHWDPLMKDTLGVWGRILLVVFPIYYPNVSLIEIQ